MKPRGPRLKKRLKLPGIVFVLSITILNLTGCTRNGVLHARESVLKEDLYTLRNAIDQFTQDKHRAPQSLNELVTAGYLRAIPTDPFTHNTDWKVVLEDTSQGKRSGPLGVLDVHSSSGEHGSDGTAYSNW